ncbi:MAG: YcaO-like family protein [Hyphomicrobiales bacterium]
MEAGGNCGAPPRPLAADIACPTVPDGRLGESASDLLRRLLPRLDTMGITRLGDITGLDRVGLPVIQAVRPLALSNSVSQGKGETPDAAAVSAVLEAAETFFAERLDLIDTTSASAEHLGVPEHHFAKHLLGNAPPGWRRDTTDWVAATNLVTGAAGWVPRDLVHTAFTVPGPPDTLFAGSTTGLAAAAVEQDAQLHGLLECIERDAMARALTTHGFFQRCRIDPGTIASPAVCALMERIRDAGLLVGLWRLETPARLPVVWCQLMEDTAPGPPLLAFPADGCAASLDPDAAACRALLEAAQSRLAAISGARDDITRASYPKYVDWERIEAHRRLLREGPRPVDFATLEAPAPCRQANWLDTLLARLPEHGIDCVFVVAFDTAPVEVLAVVRVLVPDLQPLLDG